jgi:hypothetical protein
MSEYDAQAQQAPGPDPALKRLEKFVSMWEMKGRTRATFEWLPGGFFCNNAFNLTLSAWKPKAWNYRL